MIFFNRNKNRGESEETQEKDYEYMLIRHKRRMAVLMGILVVVLGIALVAVKLFIDHKAYEAYEVTNTIKKGDNVKYHFYPYGDGFLQYSNDGISYVVDNDAVWNQAFEMKDPVVDICENYMAIADREGTKAYIYDTKGKQGEVVTTCPVLDLEVAAQGVIAAITKSDETNLIEIYDKEGDNIAMGQTVLSGDGCPLDISLSNNGTKLAASYVYIEGNMAKTKVIFYNYSEVGKNEVGRIVGGFEQYESSMISKVEFVSNDIVAAFGDDILSVYEIEEKPSLIKEIKLSEPVESIVYNSKYIGILQQSKTNAGNHLFKIFDLHGKMILDKILEFAYTDVQMSDKWIIFNNLEELYIFTVDDIFKYHGKVSDAIWKVIPGKTHQVYKIIGNEEIEEIRLK